MEIREAEPADVGAIVAMLLDDDLGATREAAAGEQLDAYRAAFAEISADPNNELIVACDRGEVIGTFQMTYIPHLTFQGGRRAQIEAVRVKRPMRGGGVGREMFQWAIRRARERGCHLVQLTTNKQRDDAVRFYESLGFTASHEGMKLYLND